MSLPYWFFPRPQRKLYRIPLTVAAIREVAEGRKWQGARELHLAFEEVLEREGIKRVGSRRDQRGSGGRTHAALLRSLGLTFLQSDGTLQLTLAGQDLAAGMPPAAILRDQVLKYQFPSPYSLGSNVKVDTSFRIRPIAFLLRLLLDQRIERLTQEEIALRVLPLAKSNDENTYEGVVARIREFRTDGHFGLEPGFWESVRSPRGNAGRVSSALGDIANTSMNWLEHTGVIEREAAEVWVAQGAEAEARRLVARSSGPLLDRVLDEEVFQRRYGLVEGRSKDTRNLAPSAGLSASEMVERRVRTTVIGLGRSRLLSSISRVEIRDLVADATGYSAQQVSLALDRVLPSSALADDQFLLGYAEMARSSRSGARDFEIATASVFQNILGLDATHIGGKGRVPDVVVTLGDGRRVIVDTKAYSNGYSLPASDERAMLEYVRAYDSTPGGVAAWLFVSSSYAATINRKIATLCETTGIPGAAVGITSWLSLINTAMGRTIAEADLLRLFQLGREIVLDDVSAFETDGPEA